MPNQPPLNPDALKAGLDAGHCAYAIGGDQDDVSRAAITGYLLAVAQPVVNSVEELDKLPMHSYVQGNDGFNHAKDWNGGWHLIVNRPSSAPHLSGSIDLPARVLYRPVVES
ncbi:MULTISPECIES: hypothetical protein [unclassified Glutamicibacter]|uniref:hypothetical protein n=1 Tax=unclassified Glutamicibacter TaxID=2627139 RepID=UPI003800F866